MPDTMTVDRLAWIVADLEEAWTRLPDLDPADPDDEYELYWLGHDDEPNFQHLERTDPFPAEGPLRERWERVKELRRQNWPVFEAKEAERVRLAALRSQGLLPALPE